MNLRFGPGLEQHQMYQGVEYKIFWEGIERQKQNELECLLMKDLLRVPARRLIDIGCGYGRLAYLYMEKCEQVVMLDSSMSLLQQARENTRGRALYIACNLYHIPFRPATFERVLNIRVLHHLQDAQAALSEFNRLLSKDGDLIFTYSNKLNLNRVIKWVAGHRKVNPFTMEPGFEWEGFLMHHPRHIQQMLSDMNFLNFTVRGSGVFDKLAEPLSRIKIEAPSGILVAPLLAQLYIAPWIFVRAQKHSGAPLDWETPLEDSLCCLACDSILSRQESAYVCPACGHNYPIRDGIVDFLGEN